jgi:hypothetical protein
MSMRLLNLASHGPNQISFALRKGKFEESGFAAPFQRFPAATAVEPQESSSIRCGIVASAPS